MNTSPIICTGAHIYIYIYNSQHITNTHIYNTGTQRHKDRDTETERHRDTGTKTQRHRDRKQSRHTCIYRAGTSYMNTLIQNRYYMHAFPYIYIYIWFRAYHQYKHLHTYTHLCIHIQIYTHTHSDAHIFAHVFRHIRTFTCKY